MCVLNTNERVTLTSDKGQLLKATLNIRPPNFKKLTPKPLDALENGSTGVFDKAKFTAVCNISLMAHSS